MVICIFLSCTYCLCFMTQNPTLNIYIKIPAQMFGPCCIFHLFACILLLLFIYFTSTLRKAALITSLAHNNGVISVFYRGYFESGVVFLRCYWYLMSRLCARSAVCSLSRGADCAFPSVEPQERRWEWSSSRPDRTSAARPSRLARC